MPEEKKGKGRGWHGDPEGHARAARQRVEKARQRKESEGRSVAAGQRAERETRGRRSEENDEKR